MIFYNKYRKWGTTMPEIVAYGVILGGMVLDIIIVLIFDK